MEKFCFAVADLYSYTFKPLLDVLLFTRSLAKSMGYRTQGALYAYYLLTAALLRALSPPLALMTAQETGLAGAFRSAHQVGCRNLVVCGSIASCMSVAIQHRDIVAKCLRRTHAQGYYPLLRSALHGGASACFAAVSAGIVHLLMYLRPGSPVCPQSLGSAVTIRPLLLACNSTRC